MDIGGIGVNAPMLLKPPEKDPAMELAALNAAAGKGKTDPANLPSRRQGFPPSRPRRSIPRS
jgi:hypothetical protein